MIIGRTNTPEFSFRATTVNTLQWRDAQLMGRRAISWRPSEGRLLRWTAGSAQSPMATTSAARSGFVSDRHGDDLIDVRTRARIQPVGTRGTLPSGADHVGPRRDRAPSQRRSARYPCPLARDPRDPWQIPVLFDGLAINPSGIKVAASEATNGMRSSRRSKRRSIARRRFETPDTGSRPPHRLCSKRPPTPPAPTPTVRSSSAMRSARMAHP